MTTFAHPRAQLGYDNDGRLSTWQNTPTAPTTTDSFLYDGAGNRVEQSVTVNGSIITTTTYVAGGLEEIASGGANTTLTKYFAARELPITERVGTNGPLSYLASDGQGTVAESFDSAGNVTSGQLYTPYGNARYSSGTSPTSMGYTGQQADGTTTLDFYHARYYDPIAGQFASADTVADGLNHYGYVHGNPTTAADPSGHYACYDDPCTRSGSRSSASQPTGSGNGSIFDGTCNRHLCPPSPIGSNGCRSDGSCGCYAQCNSGSSGSSGNSGVLPPTPQVDYKEIANTCVYGSGHIPNWCSRYYDYSRRDVNGYPMKRNTFDEADYFYFVISAGVGVSGEYVLYYLTALGIFMNSFGLSLGASFSLTGLTVLAAGYGLLLTKGTPTEGQVANFVSGLSVSVTAGTIASLSYVHSLSGSSAEQEQVDTAIAQAAVGGAIGGDTPTEFCPPAYIGPFIVATCYMN